MSGQENWIIGKGSFGGKLQEKRLEQSFLLAGWLTAANP
jgi:hypothetical protein